MESTRTIWARVTYWLLFIITPSLVVFFTLGGSVKNGAVCVGVFFLLILIGERGFRLWKKLFGVE
jgi:hypothetical protein